MTDSQSLHFIAKKIGRETQRNHPNSHYDVGTGLTLIRVGLKKRK